MLAANGTVISALHYAFASGKKCNNIVGEPQENTKRKTKKEKNLFDNLSLQDFAMVVKKVHDDETFVCPHLL